MGRPIYDDDGTLLCELPDETTTRKEQWYEAMIQKGCKPHMAEWRAERPHRLIPLAVTKTSEAEHIANRENVVRRAYARQLVYKFARSIEDAIINVVAWFVPRYKYEPKPLLPGRPFILTPDGKIHAVD